MNTYAPIMFAKNTEEEHQAFVEAKLINYNSDDEFEAILYRHLIYKKRSKFYKKFILYAFLLLLSDTVVADTAKDKALLPSIPVSIAKLEKLRTSSNFVGRVEAMEKVDIKAAASGRLKEIKFTEGMPVEKGQLLFQIEPEKYELDVKQNEASLKVSQASLENEKVQLERSKFLAANKAIAQSQLDKQKIQTLQAEASVEQSTIALYVSKMKLKQTQITAPISGRIGRAALSVGNEVGPESGPLAKIVSDKTVKIYFSVTQKELLEGLKRKDDANTVKVLIELPDGTILKESGAIDFFDISTDEKTDSMTLRALVKNTEGLLFDGEIVHIIGTRETSEKYVTVPHKSVMIDQNGAYCLVINNDGIVMAKRIITGQENAENIVVKSGIDVGDRVILSSDRLQPGMKVAAEVVP